MALAAEGAAVAIAARRGDRLEAIADRLRSQVDVLVIETDVTDEAAARAMVERTVGEFGRLDTLVNNAGVNYREPVAVLNREHVREIVHTNLSSLIYLTSLVVGRMLERRSGLIVSISSTIGHRAGPGRSVYAASKHAVEGFSKSIAVELGPLGIRANTVAPTWVETDLAAQVLSDPVQRARIESEIPLGRVLQPEEVGEIVAFLASPAAAYLNGASIPLDGGLTC